MKTRDSYQLGYNQWKNPKELEKTLKLNNKILSRNVQLLGKKKSPAWNYSWMENKSDVNM